jgi:hypothetical protein
MIPRETIKKIRQTGIQRSRISTPVFKLFRFATGMKDRQNDDAFCFNQKMDHIRKAAKNDCAPDFTTNFRKPFGMVRNALKALFYNSTKLLAQAFLLLFIKGNGIVKLFIGNTAKNQGPLHLRYFKSSLALTSLSEMTSFGFLRCSCRRRSINLASPSVNSSDSTIFSQRLRHNSICSANGRARASFNTDSELMGLNVMVFKLFASP